MTNEDRFGPPSMRRPSEPSTLRQRQAVADKLDSMANARDPDKPDETDFMFEGSFGHFALDTSGPLAEWLASFSHASDAYYNLMVRRSND